MNKFLEVYNICNSTILIYYVTLWDLILQDLTTRKSRTKENFESVKQFQILHFFSFKKGVLLEAELFH